MKIVWVYNSTDGCSYSFDIPIVFEYESKEKFVFDVLELCSEAKKNRKHTHNWIKMFDIQITCEDAEHIESDVFTLEEWVENKLEKSTLLELKSY